jgi:hypothetical protein
MGIGDPTHEPALAGQLVEQRLRIFEVGVVEGLGESVVDVGERGALFVAFGPKPWEAIDHLPRFSISNFLRSDPERAFPLSKIP